MAAARAFSESALSPREGEPLKMMAIVMTAAVRKKTKGPKARAQMICTCGFLRRRTVYLTRRKRTAPKPPAMAGAMRKPAKMVCRWVRDQLTVDALLQTDDLR